MPSLAASTLKTLGLGSRTMVMGVLNVTPDSFSDGGDFDRPEIALERAVEMARQGADILDIGGESTRPATFHDNAPLEIEEELRRVLPVIELVSRKLPGVPISIDTYKAEVAKRALEAGASMVNDISGLTYDPGMVKLVAEVGCPVVIMHLLGQPRAIAAPRYKDVIKDLSSFFQRQISFALANGIEIDQIILDPGIGFGKNAQHNLAILARLAEFKPLGRPIMIGPSRKAFIGKILGDSAPTERLEGTSAAIAIGIANGATIVRVHDVKEMVRVAKVADAVVRSVQV